MKHYNLISTLVLILLFYSCNKSEFEGKPPGKFEQGAFVINEGTFGSSNSSVSFINLREDTIYNEIFSNKNQRPIGDVLQSMLINKGLAYLVVNASNKVEVVNKDDFSQSGTIVGLYNPRYMVVANGKGYISQWGGDGSVAVADLESLEILKTIHTGTGTEGIITVGNKIWAANGGGFALDSTISVIDPALDEVTNTITVSYNPKEMIIDNGGNVWVLCYGHVQYNEDWTIARQFPSKLVKVSATSFSVLKEIVIGETLHPQHLDINPQGNKIYVGGGFGFAGIYEVDTDAVFFPGTPLIEGFFYGFNINPENGDVYGCEAPDFTNPGLVHRFSKDGLELKVYITGIGPSSVIF